MAKIDFNTRNLGVKIHDAGEYTIPENAITDKALSVPERFGINMFEDPPIVYDRFPGMTDEQVKAELDRQWTEEVWPRRVAMYYQHMQHIKNEAGERLSGAQWRYDRALEAAKGDYDDAKVVAEAAKRQDVRDKSTALEASTKAALLARTDPDDWPDKDIWLSEYAEHSTNAEVTRSLGKGYIGLSDKQFVDQAKDDGINDPGRTD